MFFHGSAGGEAGMAWHGHASPKLIPSICVLLAGQMLDNPSMSTDQSVGREMIGTDEACVVGCERR